MSEKQWRIGILFLTIGNLGILVWKHESKGLGIILALIWSMIGVIVLLGIENQRLVKLSKRYLEKGETEAYLAACESQLHRNKVKKVQATLVIGLASAYVDAGKAQEALDLLLAFKGPYPKNANGTVWQVTYDHVLVEAYLMLGRLDKAHQAFEKMKAKVAEGNFLPPYDEAVKGWVQLRQYELDVAEGRCEGAGAFLEGFLEKCESTLSRMRILVVLARVYALQNETDKEREALNFMAEKGGDTYYRQQAIKRLKQIQEAARQ